MKNDEKTFEKRDPKKTSPKWLEWPSRDLFRGSQNRCTFGPGASQGHPNNLFKKMFFSVIFWVSNFLDFRLPRGPGEGPRGYRKLHFFVIFLWKALWRPQGPLGTLPGTIFKQFFIDFSSVFSDEKWLGVFLFSLSFWNLVAYQADHKWFGVCTNSGSVGCAPR